MSTAVQTLSYSRCRRQKPVVPARTVVETAVRSPQLHIRIDSLKTQENKFSIQLPVEWYQVGLAIARSYSSCLACISMAELKARIENRCRSVLVEKTDVARDERILIYLDQDAPERQLYSEIGV